MCNYARRLIQGRLNKLIKVQIVLASTSARLLRPTCGQLPNWSWLAGDGGGGGAALHQPGVAIGGAGGGRALLSRDKGNLEHKTIAACTPTAISTSQLERNLGEAETEGKQTLLCFAQNTARAPRPLTRAARTHASSHLPPHLECC